MSSWIEKLIRTCESRMLAVQRNLLRRNPVRLKYGEGPQLVAVAFAAVLHCCISPQFVTVALGLTDTRSRTLCYMGDKIERKGSVNFVCGLPRRRRMPEDRISRGCTVAASAELTAEYTKPIQTYISSKKANVCLISYINKPPLTW